MIECVDENIYYVKKRKRRKRGKLRIFAIILVIVAVFVYYKRVVTENVITICADKCGAVSIKSVNAAIIATLSNAVLYDDLITTEKDSEGKIRLITANAYKTNALGRKIADGTQIILEENLKKGVEIPLFAYSGLTLLSGMGPDTKFNALTVSAVTCDFESNFKSTGINQTLHSIYAKIITEVKIDFPLNRKIQSYDSKVLICEAVIAGEVPEIYLNGGLFNKS